MCEKKISSSLHSNALSIVLDCPFQAYLYFKYIPVLEIEKLIFWFHVDNICAPRRAPFFIGEKNSVENHFLLIFFLPQPWSLIKTYSYSLNHLIKNHNIKLCCHCHKRTKIFLLHCPAKQNKYVTNIAW
jgi:hypothetical protein